MSLKSFFAIFMHGSSINRFRRQLQFLTGNSGGGIWAWNPIRGLRNLSHAYGVGTKTHSIFTSKIDEPLIVIIKVAHLF